MDGSPTPSPIVRVAFSFLYALRTTDPARWWNRVGWDRTGCLEAPSAEPSCNAVLQEGEDALSGDARRSPLGPQ